MVFMRTDWKNYRQLKEGEVVRYGDEELMPDSEEWDEVAARRIGKRASDPLLQSHVRYRRPVCLMMKSNQPTNHETNHETND